MSFDERVKRLLGGLTAKERAILVLKAYKEGTRENPLWRRGMPPDQIDEFNRYMRLIEVATGTCNCRSCQAWSGRKD
jgi:hypothetical protein